VQALQDTPEFGGVLSLRGAAADAAGKVRAACLPVRLPACQPAWLLATPAGLAWWG
jgi:hypothetical protein